MPSVYLLLTRTDTLFSRALHGATRSRYTHVSLALDRDMERMYSFARRSAAAPLPAGFVRENLYSGIYGRCGGADSLLLELQVSENAYRRIERRLAAMERRKAQYDYDVLGLALAGMGIVHERPGKYFCSHFVAEILEEAGALKLPCHPSLVRPQDFTRLRPLRVVYQGPLAFLGRRPVPISAAA
ncbi:hypothetical protein [Allofournierella sp.]|uniref:hypothetical protein n=1 Tax=Allofournierella sp. TaxID=1940256 RepID=UPI003AB4D083